MKSYEQRTSGDASARVLLTGGSGLVGQALAAGFNRAEIGVLRAAREAGSVLAAGGQVIPWNPRKAKAFEHPAALEGLLAAVHLSGANVAARRWTQEYKKEIVSSRTETTAAVARTLAALKRPPRVLISASATGVYGDRGNEVLTEESALGHDFLSETCVQWEASTSDAEEAGIRVVHLRLGVVLTPAGGALAKMLPLFRAGLGGRLGSGTQWMSWVTLDDVVEAVLYIVGISREGGGTGLRGAVNCIAPFPVTNAEYTKELAGVLHRPAFVVAPAFALRLGLGEMADAALLASCRAVPGKLQASGFQFGYPRLKPALEHLLAR
jgi:uncharacterized protein (TIGR01777 family)